MSSGKRRMYSVSGRYNDDRLRNVNDIFRKAYTAIHHLRSLPSTHGTFRSAYRHRTKSFEVHYSWRKTLDTQQPVTTQPSIYIPMNSFNFIQLLRKNRDIDQTRSVCGYLFVLSDLSGNVIRWIWKRYTVYAVRCSGALTVLYISLLSIKTIPRLLFSDYLKWTLLTSKRRVVVCRL